jgi:tetratricopeptide (TPR) repeat protein
MAASIVVVAAVVPGRRRRVFGLLLVAVGFVVARGPLLAVYQQGATGALSAAATHAAARAAAEVAFGVGLTWAIAVRVLQQLGRADPDRAAWLARAGGRALAVLALAVVIVAAASAGRIAHTASTQWHAFTHLTDPAGSTVSASSAGQTRLLSGAGNRYDYWRIAWNVWRANPIVGVGAGNYDRPYFAQRSTTEDILQPHSIELQTLAELGLIGLALLAVFVAGLVGGVRRARRDTTPAAAGILVAALGATVAWFTQTSVDWMHLLPGITAVALGGMAVLLTAGGQSVPRGRRRPGWMAGLQGRRPAALGIAGVAVALVMAGASLSRQALADHFRSQAQNEVAAHPAAALAAANRSLSFDADAVSTYYVKAAALARFDDAAAADAALRAALAREPQNFVTWTLLGDIAVREGDLMAAKADYTHAHVLNPRDPTLAALSVDPRAPSS